jgi:hypothetical protein
MEGQVNDLIKVIAFIAAAYGAYRAVSTACRLGAELLS